MTILGEMSFLERMQFFNGQRLFASDLQSLESDNRERRWLHNASLHQPGVGSGYAVTGNKGQREVTITPGYAIDVLGREIILTETHVEPVPPVADDGAGKSVFYDLTVSYPDDDALEESELREGICVPRGVIRLREQPVFCWVRLGADGQAVDTRLKTQIEEGIKVRVARVEIFDCQLNNAVSTAQRRNARPALQPYIASGKVFPSEVWKIKPQDSSAFGPGLEINVDTSAAGFVTRPCYNAHIVGERYFSRASTSKSYQGIFDELHLEQFLLDGFLGIFDPTVNSFRLQSLMPEIEITPSLILNPKGFFDPARPPGPRIELLRSARWYVVWIGVEE